MIVLYPMIVVVSLLNDCVRMLETLLLLRFSSWSLAVLTVVRWLFKTSTVCLTTWQLDTPARTRVLYSVLSAGCCGRCRPASRSGWFVSSWKSWRLGWVSISSSAHITSMLKTCSMLKWVSRRLISHTFLLNGPHLDVFLVAQYRHVVSQRHVIRGWTIDLCQQSFSSHSQNYQ